MSAEREERSANDRMLADSTVVLAVATIALAAVALFQLFMFRRQLHLMQSGAADTKALADAARRNAENSKSAVDTMQLATNTQLRAFVFPVNIMSLWEPLPGTQTFGWRFRSQWQNSGATPTRNLKIHTGGCLRDTPLPEDFNFAYSTEDIGSGLISPRLTLVGGIVPQGPGTSLTPQDIADIQLGKKHFYMWGWARYNDVFSSTAEHVTRFCWQLVATGDPYKFKPKSTIPDEQMVFGYIYHLKGNCADEECG